MLPVSIYDSVFWLKVATVFYVFLGEKKQQIAEGPESESFSDEETRKWVL